MTNTEFIANATIADNHLIDPSNNRVQVLNKMVSSLGTPYVWVRFPDGAENGFPAEAVTVDDELVQNSYEETAPVIEGDELVQDSYDDSPSEFDHVSDAYLPELISRVKVEIERLERTPEEDRSPWRVSGIKALYANLAAMEAEQARRTARNACKCGQSPEHFTHEWVSGTQYGPPGAPAEDPAEAKFEVTQSLERAARASARKSRTSAAILAQYHYKNDDLLRGTRWSDAVEAACADMESLDVMPRVIELHRIYLRTLAGADARYV